MKGSTKVAHQCVHCGRILPMANKELLEGCEECGNRFFFYIKEEQMKRLKETPLPEIPQEEKKQIEKDVREITGLIDEDTPVILDLESVRAVGPGKFEIDVVNLFNRDRPIIYKLGEGKYIIDLFASFKNLKDKDEKI